MKKGEYPADNGFFNVNPKIYFSKLNITFEPEQQVPSIFRSTTELQLYQSLDIYP
jgi:hypothetical protein